MTDITDKEQIYLDFCTALSIPPKSADTERDENRFGDNIAIALHLSTLSFIWKILGNRTDPTLKKKKQLQASIQNGMLSQEEANMLENLTQTHNDVAHVNASAEASRQIVADNMTLFDLACTLSERDYKRQGR